jgi:uncharacterized membrane protein YhiD involved in acid resistance
MPEVPLVVDLASLTATAHLLPGLVVSAALGAALGLIRSGRRRLAPRSLHVIHAQILLAIVGALIIVVVGNNLARAFAIVGAAGLVRYRARIPDPKDAGVMLVALALGLTVGSGMYLFAIVACVFVIAVLWVLESAERPPESHVELTVAGANATQVQTEIEQALSQKGLVFELRGSAPHELRYDITVPYGEKVRKLTKAIRGMGERHGPALAWDIRKYTLVKS